MAFQTRSAAVAIAIVLLCCCGAAEARAMKQASSAVTATVLLSHTPARDSKVGCTATIIVRNAAGQVVPGASVTYRWGATAAAPTRTGATNSSGRLSHARFVDAAARSCSLQVVDVAVPGASVALADASRPAKTVTW